MTKKPIEQLDGESIVTSDGIIQVSIPKGNGREYWLEDAMGADEWDEYDLHKVTLDPSEITIEGTPKAIRWLYDWMESGKKYWNLQGESWDADVHRDLAEVFWEALNKAPGEIPDRQKKRDVELI